MSHDTSTVKIRLLTAQLADAKGHLEAAERHVVILRGARDVLAAQLDAKTAEAKYESEAVAAFCEDRNKWRDYAQRLEAELGCLPLKQPITKLVCPTCNQDSWSEIYPSKTDPTGYTLYCRRCEEGCVSPKEAKP